MPLKPPIGRSGRAETSRQAYSIDAVNEFDPLFEDVYDYCEKMELNVDTLIHEVGAGQMEINFFHAHPLSLADEVFLFKRTVREAALRHDMYATFMAKPIAGEPGSAMHVHQSLVEQGDRPQHLQQRRRHARARSSSGTSAACRSTSRRRWRCSRPTSTATAGWCARHAAPINIQWGTDNRTVGIRSPVAGAAGAAHREPRHRRRRQPLRGAGRHAGLRLPGHQEPHRAQPRMQGRRLPGRACSCRAAWARRCSCCATRSDLAEVLGERLRHRLHRGQGDRVRRVHEGHLALGARTPAAARLSRATTRHAMNTATTPHAHAAMAGRRRGALPAPLHRLQGAGRQGLAHHHARRQHLPVGQRRPQDPRRDVAACGA